MVVLLVCVLNLNLIGFDVENFQKLISRISFTTHNGNSRFAIVLAFHKYKFQKRDSLRELL